MVTGTHILTNAKSKSTHALLEVESFRSFITQLIARHNLVAVGQVFHKFEGGGFTAVICLTESHLSIHTWPEFNYYTSDVYLCDFSRNNHNLTIVINDEIKTYFDSYDITQQIIER